MILAITPVSDRHNLLHEENLSGGNAIGEGIQYGHEWIWHLVKLVNAAAGTGMGTILLVGCQWAGQEACRFGAAASNHPSPS